MTTLFEHLVQINSDITEIQAAEFRSCLITISKHINTEPESLALSLQDWGRWLDDGGYGRENFAAILQQIAEAELGVPAASTFWTYAQSIGAAAEGIPSLIEHVQTDYPGLEQRITSLEALALDEQGLIEQTAGGMSKKGQIVTGSVVGTVVGLGVGYGIHRVLQTRRARTAKENADAIKLQAEKDAKEYTENKVREVGMITESEFKTYSRLYGDDTQDLRDVFKARSEVFDFRAYSLAQYKWVDETINKIASNLYNSYYDPKLRGLLTQEELKLCSNLPEVQDIKDVRNNRAYQKFFQLEWGTSLGPNPIVDYAKNNITVAKSKALLNMSDKDFGEFTMNEGKKFVRKAMADGDVVIVGDIKRNVDYGINIFEEEAKSDARILEEDILQGVVKDIEIDVTNEVEDLAGKLVSDIATNAEDLIAGATNKVDNEITNAEADMV